MTSGIFTYFDSNLRSAARLLQGKRRAILYDYRAGFELESTLGGFLWNLPFAVKISMLTT
jgi:hypothetical protein